MKIADSSIQLASSQNQQQEHEVTESLRMWVDKRLPESAGNRAGSLSRVADHVRISDAGLRAQANEAAQAGSQLECSDPKLAFVRQLLAALLGHDVRVFNASDLQQYYGAASTASQGVPAQSAGYGVEYDRREVYRESEQMSFEASGIVKTADGQEISFNLSLSMSRSYYMESNTSLRLGDAARKTCDPLVINFSGNAAELTDQRFAFDLNSDGTASEQINFVTGGSGFLAFDRNGDGVINNGSELFGARTGNGFAELAELDSDGNGWIDENDAAYAQLLVWTKDTEGNDRLMSLKEANVGAISLANVASPFSIKDENNELKGQVRASGFYLQESGGVGSVQQIDLTV